MKGAQRIVAVDREAARQSVRPGMTLADARAVRPGLMVCQADPRGEAETLAAIADWCGRFTPLVALDEPDGILLDISGAAHLFGGDTSLRGGVETGLLAQGYEARAALAGTPEAAWALARFSAVKMAPDQDNGKAFGKVFGPLPLAALRLAPETVQALEQAGLRRIDDLLWRPRAPLAARFGKDLHARLDAVMGRLKNPISPRFDPPAFVAEQRFASPILLLQDVERTLRDLSKHLCDLLERHDKGARRIEAFLFRVDGVVKRIAVGTSRPLNRPDEMARLFKERIEAASEAGLDTGYGFDVVRLAVQAAEPMPVRQDDLVANGPDHPGQDEDLADLVDRLGARLGFRRVTRLLGQDTHIPEFAVSAVPAAQNVPAPKRRPIGRQEPLARPIRLFEHPEPIDTIATVPDGPPMRFRWRRTLHELTAIEGPERIAPEWWRPGGPSLTRDYFRAEDQDGRRYWLFREGLFSETALLEGARPRWFLHGLFG